MDYETLRNSMTVQDAARVLMETNCYGTMDIAKSVILRALEQTRWIPVSKRLPKSGENILFSTKTDRVFEGKYFEDNTDCQWYSYRDDAFAHNNTVTAWMPLLEPYKTESEDKKE